MKERPILNLAKIGRSEILTAAALTGLITHGVAFADSSQEAIEATIEIIGGNLEINTETPDWIVKDARGTGEGWHVNLACNSDPDFCPCVEMTDEDITTVAGGISPVSNLQRDICTQITDEGLTIANAGHDEGMGTFVLSPRFQGEKENPGEVIVTLVNEPE